MASLIVSLLVAGLTPTGAAWAQTDPPPVSTPPPAQGTPAPAPAGDPASPPVTAPAPAAAATAPAPPPPTLVAPPQALPPPAPSLTAEPGTLPPLPPAEEHPPLYRQPWFWALVAVVGLTAVMITYGVASQGPSTPSTDFGNMRAF